MERNLYIMKFDEVKEGAVDVANKIKQSGVKVDTVVPLLKGGVCFASLLGDNLGVDNYACLHLKSAVGSGTNAELKEPIFLGITNKDAVVGKKVLIADDICDTGRSMMLAKKMLLEMGASEVYIATLVNVNVALKEMADYFYHYDFTKENYWIVFPWESEN